MGAESIRRAALLSVVATLIVSAALLMRFSPQGAAVGKAVIGEARDRSLTLDLPGAVPDVSISQARVPGRPIVLIDPGHGGHDPGARSASGQAEEKALTLALSLELRDLLAARGRVRVALTRTDDRYVELEERARLARRLGAGLFISIHMDHAPNPMARGVTIYSLSDVASDADAARFAWTENDRAGAESSEPDDAVRRLLDDLVLRGEMEDSAALAERIVRRAAGPVLLRPRAHQFASFHVLRRAATPAVLVEAGYISNVDDEAVLTTREGRAPLVLALAQAIEADLATRR